MRGQTTDYLLKLLDTFNPTKVLDIGSLDINGSVRKLFKHEYVGVDMRKGGNVDVVLNGHDLLTKFKEEEFDLVCSFDTFEHDDAFWVTLDQMKKVLKPGGWIVLGFPGRNCEEHDHPSDYWRFMPGSAKIMLGDYEEFSFEVQYDDPLHKWEDAIYCMGRKPCK